MFFARSRRTRSLRFRLTALYVSLLGATLVVFSSVLYNSMVRNQLASFDIDLYNHAVDIADNIRFDAFGDLHIGSDLASGTGKIVPFAVGSTFIQILSTEGEILIRSRTLGAKARLPVYRDDWRQLNHQRSAVRTIRYTEIFPGAKKNPNYRLISYPVNQRLLGNYILQLAVPMTFLEESARGLRALLLIGIPLALLLAAAVGFHLAGRALRPVNAIIEKARQLGSANLSERLPVPAAEDELRRLSVTLNELLDRLQRAFESQERFVADASHELKTPLAILRGELDLMRSRERSPEETSQFLATASQELDHLSRLVADLLTLARMDAGAASLSLQPTRMDELVIETLSRLEPLARAKDVGFSFELVPQDSAEEPPAGENLFEISADDDLLRILAKNLVENAIKFSPPGSTVRARLEDEVSAVRFTVENRGPSIPPELQAKIFERFVRAPLPGRNANEVPGAGLGLPIAKRIAAAHQGSLEVRSPISPEIPEGAVFTVRLERAAAARGIKAN
ncbi:MAG: HAMP domain-containing histidine kinase [Oligoflexia bacterium]|nr:HAMP domain-containing histidine kinase [Oligoflexia bacterium]